jgi:hypothetical protein
MNVFGLFLILLLMENERQAGGASQAGQSRAEQSRTGDETAYS